MVATVVAVAGSLVADWLLAKLAVAVFPSTSGYPHFQFSDRRRSVSYNAIVRIPPVRRS